MSNTTSPILSQLFSENDIVWNNKTHPSQPGLIKDILHINSENNGNDLQQNIYILMLSSETYSLEVQLIDMGDIVPFNDYTSASRVPYLLPNKDQLNIYRIFKYAYSQEKTNRDYIIRNKLYICNKCGSIINLSEYKGYSDNKLVECNECHIIYHKECFNDINMKILKTSICSNCSSKIYQNTSSSNGNNSSFSIQLDNNNNKISSLDSPEIFSQPTSVSSYSISPSISPPISPPILETENKKMNKMEINEVVIQPTNQIGIPIPDPIEDNKDNIEEEDDTLKDLITKIMKPKKRYDRVEKSNEIVIDGVDDNDEDNHKRKKPKKNNHISNNNKKKIVNIESGDENSDDDEKPKRKKLKHVSDNNNNNRIKRIDIEDDDSNEDDSNSSDVEEIEEEEEDDDEEEEVKDNNVKHQSYSYNNNDIIHVSEPICRETFEPFSIVYDKYNKTFAMVMPEDEIPKIVKIDYDSCPFTHKVLLITFIEDGDIFQQYSIERGDRLHNINIEKIFDEFAIIPDKSSFKYAYWRYSLYKKGDRRFKHKPIGCFKCFNIHPQSQEVNKRIKIKLIICNNCGLQYHFICVGNICPYCHNELYDSDIDDRLFISINKDEESDDDLTESDSDEERLNYPGVKVEIEKPSESYLKDDLYKLYWHDSHYFGAYPVMKISKKDLPKDLRKKFELSNIYYKVPIQFIYPGKPKYGIVKHTHIKDQLDKKSHCKKCIGEDDITFGHILSYSYKLKTEKENNPSKDNKYDLSKLSDVIECCGLCFLPFGLANTRNCPNCGIEYHTECYGNDRSDNCRICSSGESKKSKSKKRK